MNRVENNTRDQSYYSTDYNKNYDMYNSLLSTLEHLDVI